MIVTFTCMTAVHARKSYDREIKSTLFIPKGSWNSGIIVTENTSIIFRTCIIRYDIILN